MDLVSLGFSALGTVFINLFVSALSVSLVLSVFAFVIKSVIS